MPTAECLQNEGRNGLYEKARQAVGGVHLVENALWRPRHYDYLMQVINTTSLSVVRAHCGWSLLGRPGRTRCTATSTETLP